MLARSPKLNPKTVRPDEFHAVFDFSSDKEAALTAFRRSLKTLSIPTVSGKALRQGRIFEALSGEAYPAQISSALNSCAERLLAYSSGHSLDASLGLTEHVLDAITAADHYFLHQQRSSALLPTEIIEYKPWGLHREFLRYVNETENRARRQEIDIGALDDAAIDAMRELCRVTAYRK